MEKLVHIQTKQQPERTAFGMTQEQIQVLYDEVKRDNGREDLILLGPSVPDADFQKAFREGSETLAQDPIFRSLINVEQ